MPVQLTEAVRKNLPNSFESISSVAIIDVQDIEGSLEILAEVLDLVLRNLIGNLGQVER